MRAAYVATALLLIAACTVRSPSSTVERDRLAAATMVTPDAARQASKTP